MDTESQYKADHGQEGPELFGKVDQVEVVEQHMMELKLKGAVVKVTDTEEIAQGITSPIILVRKKNGKLRPCLDLREVNKCVPYRHFKMEGLKQLKEVIQVGDWMTSIDLQDGYFHVPIAKESRYLLQFKWQGSYYRFRSMPFGLSSAPLVFSKLLRPIVGLLRSEGIRMMAYLDDIIILASSLEESRKNTARVLALLVELGWLVNTDKSSLVPSQKMEYLGFLFDTKQMRIYVTKEKRKKFRSAVSRMLKKLEKGERTKLRTWASLVGKLQSLAPAVPFCRLHLQCMTRIQGQILKSQGREVWDMMINIPKEARTELEWWLEWLRGWNGNAIIQEPSQVDFFSDASDLGYGGYMDKKIVKTASQLVQGYWNQQEQQTSINQRELMAAERTIKAFLHQINKCTVKIFTDSI
jgi:hypothetical protein